MLTSASRSKRIMEFDGCGAAHNSRIPPDRGGCPQADTEACCDDRYIVGFPGETDAGCETMQFVEEMGWPSSCVPLFTPLGTPAARFPNQIPASVKEERVRL